jgi:hypothetical protein
MELLLQTDNCWSSRLKAKQTVEERVSVVNISSSWQAPRLHLIDETFQSAADVVQLHAVSSQRVWT